VPAWASKLQTASIAADMAAADVNGTVTYAGLETRLTDLDSNLSSSKTTLTSAEMSDLKTIVANLDNGMSTSAYLTNVMNSLVNGNAANATWTGGTATSTAFGNLAVASSATQFSELIDKWALGTGLPSSKVSVRCPEHHAARHPVPPSASWLPATSQKSAKCRGEGDVALSRIFWTRDFKPNGHRLGNLGLCGDAALFISRSS
jgi:hypothetical protein